MKKFILIALFASVSAFSAEKSIYLAPDATNVRVGHPYISNVFTHYDDSVCGTYLGDGACLPQAVYETKVVLLVEYNSQIQGAQQLSNEENADGGGFMVSPGHLSESDTAMEAQILFDVSDFSTDQLAMIRKNSKAESVLAVKIETSTYPSSELDQNASTFCNATDNGEGVTLPPSDCKEHLVSKPVQATGVFVTATTL